MYGDKHQYVCVAALLLPRISKQTMCGRKSSPRTEKQFENLICSQLAELSTLQTDLPHCLRHYHKPLPSAWMKTTLNLILLKNLPQST